MTRSVLLSLGLALLVGCGNTPTTPPTEKVDPAAHNHPSRGPHGGPLVEWGNEELHLEVVIDRATGTATVHVLDEEAKTPTAITTKMMTLTLTGDPPTVVTLTPDPNSSGMFTGAWKRYVGTHEAFKTDDRLAGSVSGEKDGKNYTGKFREKAVQ